MRLSEESWMTMTVPSEMTSTSSSTHAAPTSPARRNAASVFSGASAEAPRCAKTVREPSGTGQGHGAGG